MFTRDGIFIELSGVSGIGKSVLAERIRRYLVNVGYQNVVSHDEERRDMRVANLPENTSPWNQVKIRIGTSQIKGKPLVETYSCPICRQDIAAMDGRLADHDHNGCLCHGSDLTKVEQGWLLPDISERRR